MDVCETRDVLTSALYFSTFPVKRKGYLNTITIKQDPYTTGPNVRSNSLRVSRQEASI